MSETQKLAQLLRHTINVAAVLSMGFSAAHLLGYGTDNSDKSATERSGLKLHTDHLTGCQYFSTPSGALIQRLDRDGRHICIAGREAP